MTTLLPPSIWSIPVDGNTTVSNNTTTTQTGGWTNYVVSVNSAAISIGNYSIVRLNGNGSIRSSCTFVAGTVVGQVVDVYGDTFGVQITPSTTAKFGAANAAVIFGSTTNQLTGMRLVWTGTFWQEISRGAIV